VEPTSTTSPVPPAPTVQPEYGRDYCSRGRGRSGRWGGGGRWCREGSPAQQNEIPCVNRHERRRAKLTFKRDLFKAYLTSLEQAGEISPEEERKKVMFQAKVQRLDSILSNFGGPSKTVGSGEKTSEVCSPKEPVQIPPTTDYCPAKETYEFYPRKDTYPKSYQKKERKYKRKEHKKERKQKKRESKNSISEEDKVEISALKNQIKDMKPGIWALQEQLKSKKSEIDVAFESGQQERIPELKNEIAKLKQEKRAKKAQIDPLRQRLHQLKGK